MTLSELEIANFRILKQIEISPHPALNLISGDNGSGKSSVLEAIQCIATGHSFRTRKSRELIQHTADSYRVTAVFHDPNSQKQHRCGLHRERDGAIQLRLDYKDIKRQSDIALLLPIKTLTPDSHRLIQEGPEERRQYLDWGLFHVEHSFYSQWKYYKRALSQRNQLLRDHGSDENIELWNKPLATAASSIHTSRDAYIKQLSIALANRINQLDIRFNVALRYKPGMTQTEDIEALLLKNLPHHRRMRTTTDGPHRADLLVYTDDIPSKQVLSRGQQKVLVYLLHLAQLDVLASVRTTNAIVICDDLTSELDTHHTELLVDQLSMLGNQVFITGVDLSSLTHRNHQRFHMEHGCLKKGL